MITVLVLAGSRQGRPDPMAVAAGLSHKALLPAGGVPMLLRVLRALQACPAVGRIIVSAEQPDSLLDPFAEALPVLRRASAASPSRSVAAVLAEFGTPLLVTTADHALLSPAMLSHVIASASPYADVPGADVIAAVARSEVILAAYPDTRRTWLRFRDGSFSGCNLFLLRTARAARVVDFWQAVEQERKHPLVLARLVGPMALAGYALRLMTVQGGLRRLGRRIGARLAIVEMPFAEAAIDVDKPDDLALVETILSRRTRG